MVRRPRGGAHSRGRPRHRLRLWAPASAPGESLPRHAGQCHRLLLSSPSWVSGPRPRPATVSPPSGLALDSAPGAAGCLRADHLCVDQPAVAGCSTDSWMLGGQAVGCGRCSPAARRRGTWRARSPSPWGLLRHVGHCPRLLPSTLGWVSGPAARPDFVRRPPDRRWIRRLGRPVVCALTTYVLTSQRSLVARLTAGCSADKRLVVGAPAPARATPARNPASTEPQPAWSRSQY